MLRAYSSWLSAQGPLWGGLGGFLGGPGMKSRSAACKTSPIYLSGRKRSTYYGAPWHRGPAHPGYCKPQSISDSSTDLPGGCPSTTRRASVSLSMTGGVPPLPEEEKRCIGSSSPALQTRPNPSWQRLPFTLTGTDAYPGSISGQILLHQILHAVKFPLIP